MLSDQVDPAQRADEHLAGQLAEIYKHALSEARKDPDAALMIGPGRFLMPGELKGAPLLTFAPLRLPNQGTAPEGSLWAMMSRRFESYKANVVHPFFTRHFARLDRQIVLVDALSALNRGPQATKELQQTLSEILSCFRPGAKSWLSPILGRRIDRIVFAATKADHLHQESHDRLEAILARLVEDAIIRAEREGAEVRVVALAAIRATREVKVAKDGAEIPCIEGIR